MADISGHTERDASASTHDDAYLPRAAYKRVHGRPRNRSPLKSTYLCSRHTPSDRGQGDRASGCLLLTDTKATRCRPWQVYPMGSIEETGERT